MSELVYPQEGHSSGQGVGVAASSAAKSSRSDHYARGKGQVGTVGLGLPLTQSPFLQGVIHSQQEVLTMPWKATRATGKRDARAGGQRCCPQLLPIPTPVKDWKPEAPSGGSGC